MRHKNKDVYQHFSKPVQLYIEHNNSEAMRGSRKFFFVDEGRDTTISGPSSARQRNAILMAFRWRANDGQTLNAGLIA